MIAVPLVFSGLVALVLAADSRPASAGDAPEADLVFHLNGQQVREVERLRKFRPTPAQLAVLRAVNPTCPNLYEVSTARFQGCCCSGANRFTWTGPRTIEIAALGLRTWDNSYWQMLMDLALMGDA